jgi:hypothetical protein
MVKISAGAAVVIVIIVVVAGVYFLTKKPEFVIYPGATSLGISLRDAAALGGMSLPEGIQGGVYTTPDSVSDVMEWYRGEMADWTKISDNVMEMMGVTMGMLVYLKEGRGVGIMAMSGGEIAGTMIVYVEGPAEEFAALGI